MTKYQKYHKKYTVFGDAYQLVLPLEMEGMIPEDDSVRLLSHEVGGNGLQKAVSGILCERQKSGGGPQDHVQGDRVCILAKHLLYKKDRTGVQKGHKLHVAARGTESTGPQHDSKVPKRDPYGGL